MHSSRPLNFATVVIAALAGLSACSSPDDDGVATPPAANAPARAAAPSRAGLGTGKVLETINAASYTYVRVEIGGSEVWAAGPQVAVKVGDTVTLPAGMPMTNYHSATLDRTFPLVYFVAAIQTAGAAPAAADPHAGLDPHAAVPKPAPAPAAAPVARLDGGQSVEEIVTGGAGLAGKDVAVRGRVVKFNAGIMGANWIHIQDGTGTAGTNDLTVTTDATVAVGDVVVVRGKVTTDKDFGAGYRFAVILEKAAVAKE